MLEIFSSKNSEHLKAAQALRFSYASTPMYLDLECYTFTRNGERLIVWQDPEFKHVFPAIFRPQNPANWENTWIVYVTDQELAEIKSMGIKITYSELVGPEFYFATKAFTAPTNKNFNHRVRQFKKLYRYRILPEYPQEKVMAFYEFWKEQKARKINDIYFETEKFFIFCVQNPFGHPVKKVHIEIDDQLVGLAYGIKHSPGRWVGLHLLADYRVKGLSRVLQQERAKLFEDCEIFTLGTSPLSGIEQYKQELQPVDSLNYTFISTGGKKLASSLDEEKQLPMISNIKR